MRTIDSGTNPDNVDYCTAVWTRILPFKPQLDAFIMRHMSARQMCDQFMLIVINSS